MMAPAIVLAALAAGVELQEEAARRAEVASARVEKLEARIRTERQELQRQLERSLTERDAAEAELGRLRVELDELRAEQAVPGESNRARRARLDAWAAELRGFAGVSSEVSVAELAAVLDHAVDQRLQAVDAAARVTHRTEPVVARNGLVRDAPVLRIGTVLALAGADEPAATGFLEMAEPLRVAGVSIDGEQAPAFRRAAHGELGAVPFDIDGSLTRTTGALRRRFGERLEAGGFFVWPIGFIGLLGLVLVLERAWSLFRHRIADGRAQDILGAIRSGAADRLTETLTTQSSFERVARVGLESRDRSMADREAALETALLEEEPRLQRSLSLIAACAGIAPLLGLLGTVTGMIATFEVITVHGTGNPKLLSGGISEALVTTQFGLLVAVPLLLAHAVLHRVVQRRGSRLESLRSALLESPDANRLPGPQAWSAAPNTQTRELAASGSKAG